MTFKSENPTVISRLAENGSDIFAYVKDPVEVPNQFGLYMVPCVRKGDSIFRISSNVPIPGNCLVRITAKHYMQNVDRNGLQFKSHQYVLSIKDPLIIQL